MILLLNYIEEKIQDIIVIANTHGIKRLSKKELNISFLISILLAPLINTITELITDNYFILRSIQILINISIIYIFTNAALSIVLSIYLFSYVLIISVQYVIAFVLKLLHIDFTSYYIGIIGNLITILSLLIIFSIFPIKNIYNTITKKHSLCRIILANTFIFITFIDFIYKTDTSSYKTSFPVYLTCFIVLFLINYVIIHNEIELQKKNIELKNIKQEYNLYDELINQIRSKQHEYDNRIATLSALPTVHKDYDSLVNSLATYTNFIKSDDKLLDILHINNKIIASFLFYKYKEFDRADKTLNLNIKNQSIKSHLSEPLLVDMLGILIDNMFEAIDPGDSCELIIDNNAGKTIIETKNKGCELTHDIQANLFRRGYSTKTKDNSESTIRGYGLYNLRKILLKNKGSFEVYNEYSSDKKNVFIIFHIEV